MFGLKTLKKKVRKLTPGYHIKRIQRTRRQNQRAEVERLFGTAPKRRRRRRTRG